MNKLLASLLVLLSIALAGCNTMHGLGKDVEQLGGKIQKKAQ